MPVELYVAHGDLDALRDEYLIADASEVANVVLRIVEDHVAVPHAGGVAATPIVALDLLEAGDPRAVEAAGQLFARIVQAHRGR